MESLMLKRYEKISNMILNLQPKIEDIEKRAIEYGEDDDVSKLLKSMKDDLKELYERKYDLFKQMKKQ